MKDQVYDAYIIMLSKQLNWSLESRVFETRWFLAEIGVPLEVELVGFK